MSLISANQNILLIFITVMIKADSEHKGVCVPTARVLTGHCSSVAVMFIYNGAFLTFLKYNDYFTLAYFLTLLFCQLSPKEIHFVVFVVSPLAVMRTQGSLRLILNTKLWPQMQVDKASEKSVRITAMDTEDQGVKVFLISVCVNIIPAFNFSKVWKLFLVSIKVLVCTVYM